VPPKSSKFIPRNVIVLSIPIHTFEGLIEVTVGFSYQRKGKAPETACESLPITNSEVIELFSAGGVMQRNLSYSDTLKMVATF
jgi:hypothetical protein